MASGTLMKKEMNIFHSHVWHVAIAKKQKTPM